MHNNKVARDINRIRETFLHALEQISGRGDIESVAAVEGTSKSARQMMDQLRDKANERRIATACDAKMNCAIVGSSGHGKTTILSEMFPDLCKSGWLVTDVTDTTSQSLRIGYEGNSSINKQVTVRSWSAPQIKSLLELDEVRAQNEADGIEVLTEGDAIVIDGSQIATTSKSKPVFADRIALNPFPTDYLVPPEKLDDEAFIRGLTVKETSERISKDAIIRFGDLAYDALQLRAVVKEVELTDSFSELIRWVGDDADEIKSFSFIDTPGLSTESSEKDEVLRHPLGQKSTHLVKEMWANDELDFVIHLALCGRESDFADLWKSLERDAGSKEQLSDLEDRLILAVNGFNKYFTDPNLSRKHEDPTRAEAEGDHFETTIEDNILKKMSPRGSVKPARICFLDSNQHVEDYESFYANCRTSIEEWGEEGRTGHVTLKRLGLLPNYAENVDALADPGDRGIGYMVRQLLDVSRQNGPKLLVRKYLLKTKLLDALEKLAALIDDHYDAEGRLNQRATSEALQECLAFVHNRAEALDDFATVRLDPVANQIAADPSLHGDAWAASCFSQMVQTVIGQVIEESEPSPEIKELFQKNVSAQATTWLEQWGYDKATFEKLDMESEQGIALLAHCLKRHSREILHLLTTGSAESQKPFEQTEADQQAVSHVRQDLADAIRLATTLCQTHGA